jgi:cytochrome c-type biogenesis protein CcmI
MMIVATVLLVAALPFLLWPLLRPAEPAGEPVPAPEGRDLLFHRVEELELDLASGRIDHGEAARRLAELRTELG